MDSKAKTREGAKISSLPLFVSRKTTHSNNVFVGDNAVHVRHAEQVLGAEAEQVPRVTDDDILGHGNRILWISSLSKLDLSPNVRKRVGVWAADGIVKGSAAASAIVRQAVALLKLPPEKASRDLQQSVADFITHSEITEMRGAIWYAAHLLLTPPPDLSKWEAPWKSARWITKDTPIEHRLNALYRELVGWAYVRQNDRVGTFKFGVTPSRQQAYRAMNLDVKKVYATICELSRWRNSGESPYVCALAITLVWSRS